MIATKPGTKAGPNFRLPKQKATVYWVDSDIYEKVTLSRKKNMIKILPKLYESATSHSTVTVWRQSHRRKERGVQADQ